MIKNLKKLPIGIQGFKKIIESDYLYIDKTEYLYNLIKGGEVYFLSRPRRFGKSLTCSTFEEIFSGNKELFKGLYIYNSDYEWKKHPVIHLSFTTLGYQTDIELKESLMWFINSKAKEYDVDLSLTPSIIGPKFYTLIDEIFKKHGPVVIIIDEYDKPLIEHITNLEMAQKNRDILKSFYDTFKDVQKFLKFIFITGVSKFSRTSIFSSMNNLKDISLDDRVSTMIGYTKKEILDNFADYIKRFAEQKQFTNEQMMQELTEWYDGYCFQKLTNDELQKSYKIYNPFSILLALDMQNIDNYWFQSGTPTFLINLIKKKNYPMIDIENAKIKDSGMGSFEIDDIPLENLLFQTGYLTIKDYNPSTGNYTLSYPNFEIRSSLTDHIIESMAKLNRSKYSDYIEEFKNALNQNNLEKLFKTFEIFFADIPCKIHIKHEKYFQTIFYLTLKSLGADIVDIVVEDQTNRGYVDAVVKTNTHIYVIEFKFNKSAQEGMDQIHDKKYYEKFRLENKKLTLIGLNFDLKEKNVLESDWVVREL